jgi:hypothetical protein
VLSLCAAHPVSARRLLRLSAQAFLRAYGGGSANGSAAANAAAAAKVAACHGAVLVPAVYEELRDRLVAVCVLNLGAPDAEGT